MAPADAAAGRVRLAPDLPPVNLAIRVRKPLDDGLADQIHLLRREGVRTSKVELIEMLLWESAGAAPASRASPAPETVPETPPAGPPVETRPEGRARASEAWG